MLAGWVHQGGACETLAKMLKNQFNHCRREVLLHCHHSPRPCRISLRYHTPLLNLMMGLQRWLFWVMVYEWPQKRSLASSALPEVKILLKILWIIHFILIKHQSKLKSAIIIFVSVVIDSGPRYEVAYPNGICHFLEKLSFGVSIFHKILLLLFVIKSLLFT